MVTLLKQINNKFRKYAVAVAFEIGHFLHLRNECKRNLSVTPTHMQPILLSNILHSSTDGGVFIFEN